MSNEDKGPLRTKQADFPTKKNELRMRARMIQAIRLFFIERGYLEVETPLIIPAPAPEAHIDAVHMADGRYLHTSPELCMKRLLAGGHEKIFQVCKCFRMGERGDRHLPEFTILEWYRAGIDYLGLMDECEELILEVSKDIGLGEKIRYLGREVSLAKPWDRISVEQAFRSLSPVTLEEALAQGIYDELMVQEIEPCLGLQRPVFVYDYPAVLGAQAQLRKDNPDLAERFEAYIGGVELANGFSELTDAWEQRDRFAKDNEKRKSMGKARYPIPEKFLRALDHMPAAAGIALGVDRLAMIFSGNLRVDEVVSFTPEEL